MSFRARHPGGMAPALIALASLVACTYAPLTLTPLREDGGGQQGDGHASGDGSSAGDDLPGDGASPADPAVASDPNTGDCNFRIEGQGEIVVLSGSVVVFRQADAVTEARLIARADGACSATWGPPTGFAPCPVAGVPTTVDCMTLASSSELIVRTAIAADPLDALRPAFSVQITFLSDNGQGDVGVTPMPLTFLPTRRDRSHFVTASGAEGGALPNQHSTFTTAIDAANGALAADLSRPEAVGVYLPLEAAVGIGVPVTLAEGIFLAGGFRTDWSVAPPCTCGGVASLSWGMDGGAFGPVWSPNNALTRCRVQRTQLAASCGFAGPVFGIAATIGNRPSGFQGVAVSSSCDAAPSPAALIAFAPRADASLAASLQLWDSELQVSGRVGGAALLISRDAIDSVRRRVRLGLTRVGIQSRSDSTLGRVAVQIDSDAVIGSTIAESCVDVSGVADGVGVAFTRGFSLQVVKTAIGVFASGNGRAISAEPGGPVAGDRLEIDRSRLMVTAGSNATAVITAAGGALATLAVTASELHSRSSSAGYEGVGIKSAGTSLQVDNSLVCEHSVTAFASPVWAIGPATLRNNVLDQPARCGGPLPASQRFTGLFLQNATSGDGAVVTDNLICSAAAAISVEGIKIQSLRALVERNVVNGGLCGGVTIPGTATAVGVSLMSTFQPTGVNRNWIDPGLQPTATARAFAFALSGTVFADVDSNALVTSTALVSDPTGGAGYFYLKYNTFLVADLSLSSVNGSTVLGLFGLANRSTSSAIENNLVLLPTTLDTVSIFNSGWLPLVKNNSVAVSCPPYSGSAATADNANTVLTTGSVADLVCDATWASFNPHLAIAAGNTWSSALLGTTLAGAPDIDGEDRPLNALQTYRGADDRPPSTFESSCLHLPPTAFPPGPVGVLP